MATSTTISPTSTSATTSVTSSASPTSSSKSSSSWSPGEINTLFWIIFCFWGPLCYMLSCLALRSVRDLLHLKSTWPINVGLIFISPIWFPFWLVWHFNLWIIGYLMGLWNRTVKKYRQLGKWLSTTWDARRRKEQEDVGHSV